MNHMNLHEHFLEGEIYVRDEDIENFSNSLLRKNEPSGQYFVANSEKRPTHF